MCVCEWGWGCATIGATFQQAEIYVGYKLRGLRRLLDRLYQAKSGADTQITNMSAADKLPSRAHASGTESRRVVVAIVVVAVIVVIAVYSLVLIGWKPGGKIKSLWCHTKQQMGCTPLPLTPVHPPAIWLGTATPRSHHCLPSSVPTPRPPAAGAVTLRLCLARIVKSAQSGAPLLGEPCEEVTPPPEGVGRL